MSVKTEKFKRDNIQINMSAKPQTLCERASARLCCYDHDEVVRSSEEQLHAT